MTQSLAAGAIYFVVVFAAAFALGALRVTFIVPAFGNLLATLIELPFTLFASWLTCVWVGRRWPVTSLRQALAMAICAFVLLMGAEVAGSILIFGRTFRDHIGSYGTAAGALGLAGQIAFGLLPIVQYLLPKTGKAIHPPQ